MKSIEERCEEIATERGYVLNFAQDPNNEDTYPKESIHYEIKLQATEEYYREYISGHPGSGQIRSLVFKVHENAKQKGFYDPDVPKNIGEKLMLIVSEISEALEADRKGRRSVCGTLTGVLASEDFEIAFRHYVKDTFEDELADVVIRIFDLAGWQNIDLEWHILQKMRYNSTREKMHGKKY
jgi:NTP pyrophosphatase (non-canonical NTP hydrolase)